MAVVSVIIPTYNHQLYVLETLNSVFSQTYTDYEVIVVNDGSPDETAQLLRPLVETGQIRYIEQANTGQATARNRGLAEARGEFIAFLDDDDLWPPDKLKWQVEMLKAYPEASLVGGQVVLIRNGKPEKYQPVPIRIGLIQRDHLAENAHFYSPGQTLIRRESLKMIGGFDPTIWGADDYDLYLRLEQTGAVYMENKVSLYYRLHHSNASSQRDRMLLNCHKVAQKHFPDFGSANSQKIYRFIYEFVGRERIGSIKGTLRNGDFHKTISNIRRLMIFLQPAMNDCVLAKKIAYDLLPSRMKKKEST